jgi:sulfonate transport system substrate-binding protein
MNLRIDSLFSTPRRLGLVLTLACGLVAGPALAQTRTELRIGYQKYGTLTILKARGDLEKRLAPQGVDVKWTEFPAGPQLL